LLATEGIEVSDLLRGVDEAVVKSPQAEALEHWLVQLLQNYGDRVLVFDSDAAQLTVVKSNTADFAATGVALRNPFHDAREVLP